MGEDIWHGWSNKKVGVEWAGGYKASYKQNKMVETKELRYCLYFYAFTFHALSQQKTVRRPHFTEYQKIFCASLTVKYGSECKDNSNVVKIISKFSDISRGL